MATFTCKRCGAEKEIQASGGTGYAVDDTGAKTCYACCADVDRKFMETHNRISLYLSSPSSEPWKVTNWPGTLSFPVKHKRTGSHNMAGKRFDVWFSDHKGNSWHGVQYGENTQVCHCRKMK